MVTHQKTDKTAPACQKSGFTPGPWNVEKPYGEPGVYVSGPDTVLIAKVWNDSEANASLIAAAPDLLVALERVATWQHETINSGTMTMGELFNITYGMINAAISRAKGGK
jgi:hypothetical protein